MVNQQKIITMTKLALYDKHDGPADRAASDYFRHDYIYRKNLGTRLAVGLGSVLILALYWASAIFSGDIDVFELNIQQHLTESILFVLAVLAMYSLIGTVQGTREYYLVQKRLNQYQNYLRHLERLDERKKRPAQKDETLSEARRREARRRQRRESLQESRLDTMGTSTKKRPITSSIHSDELIRTNRKDSQRRYGTDTDNT